MRMTDECKRRTVALVRNRCVSARAQSVKFFTSSALTLCAYQCVMQLAYHALTSDFSTRSESKVRWDEFPMRVVYYLPINNHVPEEIRM
jgi:hypothetical protein